MRKKTFVLFMITTLSVCASACAKESNVSSSPPIQMENPTSSSASSSGGGTSNSGGTSSSGGSTSNSDNKNPSDAKDSSESTNSDSKDTSTEKTSSRDATPIVLVPSADGTETYGNDLAVIDASNVSEGYLMVSYLGDNSKVKLQITGSDQNTYTYDLHGGYEVFPLTSESGDYTVNIFENISGSDYSIAYSTVITASIENEFGPYLYPNQYVNFNASMKTVTQSKKLAKKASSDLDVVSNVYNYLVDNITYDYDKAATVSNSSGYLPVVDDVLKEKTGICFDYAAVMATMLRVQNIPTRLEVGSAGDTYHAWVSTYISDVGWINGIIEFDGNSWQMMDPTFAASSSSKSTQDFITDADNYVTKYVY